MFLVIIIGKSIDKNLLIKNSATRFVVDNKKKRQQGEDPGNQYEFHFNDHKLFISVLLLSTLVTFLIAVSRSKNVHVFYGQLLILKISKRTIKVSFSV